MVIQDETIIGKKLWDKAVDLGSRGSESHWYAFPQDAALLIVDKLEEASLLILGGDVWKKEGSCYLPAHANWHYDPVSSDSQQVTVSKAVETARRHIAKLEKLADGNQPYFEFVIG